VRIGLLADPREEDRRLAPSGGGGQPAGQRLKILTGVSTRDAAAFTWVLFQPRLFEGLPSFGWDGTTSMH
jgi:hypothetical protein